MIQFSTINNRYNAQKQCQFKAHGEEIVKEAAEHAIKVAKDAAKGIEKAKKTFSYTAEDEKYFRTLQEDHLRKIFPRTEQATKEVPSTANKLYAGLTKEQWNKGLSNIDLEKK